MSSEQSAVKTYLPSVAGMAGAMAVRSAITKAYAARNGTEPPVDPGAEGAGWRQAIGWTALMASGAAVGRLVSRYVVGEQLDKRLGGTRELKDA